MYCIMIARLTVKCSVLFSIQYNVNKYISIYSSKLVTAVKTCDNTLSIESSFITGPASKCNASSNNNTCAKRKSQ